MSCSLKKYLGFLILVICLYNQGHAKDSTSFDSPLIQGPDIPDNFLLHNKIVRYYIDTTHHFTDNEIIHGKAENLFTQHSWWHTRIEIPTATYWTRFRLSPSGIDKPKILEILEPSTELISVYFPVGKNGWIGYPTGSGRSWYQRPFQHKNFVFNVPVDLDSTRHVYVKVDSPNGVRLMFKIRGIEDFSAYSLNEYLILGIFYGIIIFLVIYNLLFFINTRYWVYLFYCFSVIAAAGNTLINDGLGFAYLWPKHPELIKILGYYVFPLSFTVCYSLYAYFFFSDLGGFIEKYRKIILYTLVIYVVYFIARSIFFTSTEGFDSFYVIPFTIIYLVYIFAFIKGFTFARFFILGSTFALFSIIIDQLRIHGMIIPNTLNIYIFNIGIILDSMSLSLALVDRYSYFKKKEVEIRNREIAYLKEIGELRDKVNIELEQKVEARTKELLEEKNKLTNIISQLEKMSIELDKNNWQLKRNIQQEKQARMNAIEILFEEFLQLYPTPAYCLDLLEEWKWEKGFVCQKCSNDKYSQREDKSRKCSKCGTIESVTANTLFHGLKFPLHLAFYMTYRVIQNEGCKPEELSQITGISVPTCRNYKKHVLEYKEQLLKKKKIKSINSWVQLISEKESVVT